MFFEGVFSIKAPREKVWSYISNPELVAKTLPELKELKIHSENRFTAKVRLGIGWIKGDFDFDFTIADIIPGAHARLLSHGTGVKSQIDFDAVIDLTDSPEGGSILSWKANVMVGGLLASVGQRLIGSAAEKIVNQLFEGLRQELER
jgi:carbon monoxide dehydrogenase subunit G